MEYTIKEVSEKFNTSPYTLRYYEKEGLIPAVRRSHSGQRLYGEHDLEWIALVRCMRATGMSIASTKEYIALCRTGESTIEERRQILVRQKEIIERQLSEYQGFLNIVERKLAHYDEKFQKNGLLRIPKTS